MLLLVIKLIEKITNPGGVKECYNSCLNRKNTGLVKQSKIFTQQLKATEKPTIVDIKLVIAEHPKISHKLPKTMRPTGKVF